MNLHQLHIRCIVSCKVGSPYDFRLKVVLSKVNDFIHLDEISFDNFKKSSTVLKLIEKYKALYGIYPEAIRADKIYQTRANTLYCRNLGNRLSSKPLGRFRKDKDEQEGKRNMETDLKKRQEIDSVFGVAKTNYGLSKLMTKLPESQKASVCLSFS